MCDAHNSESSYSSPRLPSFAVHRFRPFSLNRNHVRTHKFPANEPERLLAQLAKDVMNAITTNNKYMNQAPNNSNAVKINTELLNLFTIIEGYVDSTN